MKVLILHPKDRLSSHISGGEYDLVVDLGRISTATHEDWTRRARCQVIGIHEFAQGDDLYRVREILQLGAGRLIDGSGIDWWNVLSPAIVTQLQQLMLIHRLARHLNSGCEIYSSRVDFRAAALHRLLGGSLSNLEATFAGAVRRIRHYREVASKFDSTQLWHIAQDKFDDRHAMRRRFTGRKFTSARPSILLPSAYVSVSRTALSFAGLFPDQQFLLVCARDSAKVRDVTANVQMISLDSYFSSPNEREISLLVEKWEQSKIHLLRSAPEYESAAAVGTFARTPSLIRWGITIRNAWKRLFENQDLRSCFCADHNNPYTRIPLLLARHAGIPAIACHHGALDLSLALTRHDADLYVAKTEMERDYMIRICGIPAAKVLCVTPRTESKPASSDSRDKPWLVFFSEPFDSPPWREDEVYSELLPQLWALSQKFGLKLVFKLHPFETLKSHRRLHRRHLGVEAARQIEIITGPISEELWQNTRLAITPESSVALECTDRDIPIFLCGWLRDSFSQYIEQYQRFNVGQLLETPVQIRDIPHLLQSHLPKAVEIRNERLPNDVETLRDLLTATHLPLAVSL